MSERYEAGNYDDLARLTIAEEDSALSSWPCAHIAAVRGEHAEHLIPSAMEWFLEADTEGTLDEVVSCLTDGTDPAKLDVSKLEALYRNLYSANVTHCFHGAVYPALQMDRTHRRNCVASMLMVEHILGLRDSMVVEDMDTLARETLGCTPTPQPPTPGTLDLDTLIPLIAGDCSKAAHQAGHDLRFLPNAVTHKTPFVATMQNVETTEGILLFCPNGAVYDAVNEEVVVETQFLHLRREEMQEETSLCRRAVQMLVDEAGGVTPIDDVPPSRITALLEQLRSNATQLSQRCVASRRKSHGLGASYEARHAHYPADGMRCEQSSYVRLMRRFLFRNVGVSFLRFPKSQQTTPAAEAWVAEATSLADTPCTALKALGTKAFTEQDYVQAARLYTTALRADDRDCMVSDATPTLCANTALCYLNLSQNRTALGWCNRGLAFDFAESKIVDKLFFRRATANLRIGEREEAREDLLLVKGADAVSLYHKEFSGTDNKDEEGDKGANSDSTSPLDKTAWTRGLSSEEQYTWLVDCYRMRVDDAYTLGGNMKGLYAEQSVETIFFDFLIFVKLCELGRHVPEKWDWAACITGPGTKLLRYAFEKSDAQEKYGSENVFAAVTGGRSLRYTAMQIYGSDVTGFEMSKEESDLERFMSGVFDLNCINALSSGYMDDLGGEDSWATLHQALVLLFGGNSQKKKPNNKRNKNTKRMTKAKQTPCTFFERGNCRYGEGCRFKHN